MNKKILNDYTDACEVIKETEAEIRKLKRKKSTVFQTNVKGSNPEWPYQEQHFQIQGTTFTYAEDGQLRIEEQLLEKQRRNAEELKNSVEEWLNTIPFRMQRIIRYKIFNELTWEEVAKLMGRKCTGESVRQEYRRFMEEK